MNHRGFKPNRQSGCQKKFYTTSPFSVIQVNFFVPFIIHVVIQLLILGSMP